MSTFPGVSEVERAILGDVVDPVFLPSHLNRTRLRLDFSSLEPPEVVTATEDFNAVGSYTSQDQILERFHLPVLALPAAPKLQRQGQKAILFSRSPARYAPTSELKDVLGDNGIDLEVFNGPVHPTLVKAIALRDSRRKSDVELFHTTESGAGHPQSQVYGSHNLYIQRRLNDNDHTTLLRELGAVGIIQPEWLSVSEELGMGVAIVPSPPPALD